MTENVTVTEISTEVEPQDVKADDFALFADKDVITGIKDITVHEDTGVNLNDLVYADKY